VGRPLNQPEGDPEDEERVQHVQAGHRAHQSGGVRAVGRQQERLHDHEPGDSRGQPQGAAGYSSQPSDPDPLNRQSTLSVFITGVGVVGMLLGLAVSAAFASSLLTFGLDPVAVIGLDGAWFAVAWGVACRPCGSSGRSPGCCRQ